MCFLSSKCALRQVKEALLNTLQKENYSLPGLKVACNMKKLNFSLIEIWLQFEAL